MSDKHTVVLAVDNSNQAQEAFEWYVRYLKRAGDRLILLHCTEAKAHDESEHLEKKYTQLMQQHNVDGTFVCQYGHPGAVIVETAEKEDARCIVMGTRGMGAVKRTILGSTSEHVLHHSHRPVLVYRK